MTTRKRRTVKQQFLDDWMTWAVRAMLLGIGSLLLWQTRTLDTMSTSIAVIEQKVTQHDDAIKAIWQGIKDLRK